MDEPTVGLDPKQIIEIRELIKELAKKHTVILSSHIMQEVSAVCDTVLIINHGKLVLIDKPENLSSHLGMNGGIKLSIKGDQKIVTNILKNIDNISKVEEEEAIEDGVCELTVYTKENEDVHEAIFLACSKANTPILEMSTIK